MQSVNGVTVEKVRLRGAQMDAPLARQRLSYVFSSVNLCPSRLSPSSVLVVRTMSDPLPGGLAKQLSTAAAPARAWEEAAVSCLSGFRDKAVRPARSVVPPSAEAVLFADHGELLACLALDCTTGGALGWWWTSILRQQFVRGSNAPSDLWPLVWADQPLYVPGALHHLDERRQAQRVLERITPLHAWRLLLAVAGACGLPLDLLTAVRGGQPTAPGERRSQVPTKGCTDDAAGGQARPGPSRDGTASRPGQGEPCSGPHPPDPPWEPHLPASTVPAALGLERRALLGVSLLLHRAPRLVASAHFAPRMRSWLNAEHLDVPAPAPARTAHPAPSSPDTRAAGHAFPDTRGPGADVDDEQTRGNGSAAPTAAPAGAPAASRTGHADDIRQTGDHRRPGGMVTAHATAGDRRDAATLADPSLASATTLPGTSRASGQGPQALVERPHTEVHFEEGCRTGLGGIFYLVHVLLRSELLSFDVGLRGWALLELLARCLLHREWPAIADDPVWDALAELDFRDPATHPGAEFTPQDTYRAPQSWLRGLDEIRRCARHRSGRLEVWLAEGFPILDTAPMAIASCARMTRRERRAFRRDAGVRAAGLELTPELRRFLHFVLPYVRWRLRRALGGTSLMDVLELPGTLYITPSHVDLVMRMKQISVAARLAGLDANPGWTPELGRIIKFHFVDDLGATRWNGAGR